MTISIRAELYDETGYQVGTELVELTSPRDGPPSRIELDGNIFMLKHYYGDRAKYQIGCEDDDIPF